MFPCRGEGIPDPQPIHPALAFGPLLDERSSQAWRPSQQTPVPPKSDHRPTSAI
jgi:hypothetical protein